MGKATTNDEFIKRAKNVYGDKYDYKNTLYKNTETPLIVTCLIHGDFILRPLKFLKGRECCECKKNDCRTGNTKKLNTDEFISRSKEIFGDTYNYSKTLYKNYKTKVIIGCSTHGDFEIVPNYHLSDKSGCQKCAKETIIQKNTISKEEFIKRAIKVHGNKYNYSKIDYVNMNCKIKLNCDKHGEFQISALHHIYSNGGCQRCGYEITSLKTRDTFQDFLTKANNKHNNKYDYSFANYISSLIKIEINCSKHGLFKQAPYIHISGQGCPVCNESKGEKEIRNWLIKNNIKFESQKKFDGCKNKNHLPFDFYLPEHNICIEFNGTQHYKMSTYFGQKSFE